jgi:hypothetical protein
MRTPYGHLHATLCANFLDQQTSLASGNSSLMAPRPYGAGIDIPKYGSSAFVHVLHRMRSTTIRYRRFGRVDGTRIGSECFSASEKLLSM